MKITVDTDRMRVVSGEIRTVVDTLRNNMDAIELLVNSMGGEWQGDAGKAYAGRLICVRRDFKQVEHIF